MGSTSDQDANPNNGIIISEGVQRRAEDWSLDINSNNFNQELESIRSDLEEEYENFSGFPDGTTARSYLEWTIRCSYSGAYVGTYDGTDRGIAGILVSAKYGDVYGLAYSTVYDRYLTIGGHTSISYDQNAVASGITSDGTTFEGHFTSVNNVRGTWVYPPDPSLGNGNFSGSRVGGDQYAVYRATGIWSTYGDTQYGVFTFDINGSGRVTGKAYNIPGDVVGELSGSLSGNTISVTVDDGTTAFGTLDQDGGLTGRFDHPDLQFSGTVTGDWCPLDLSN